MGHLVGHMLPLGKEKDKKVYDVSFMITQQCHAGAKSAALTNSDRKARALKEMREKKNGS